MNTAGTIDRPLTYDPQKQAPMKPSTHDLAGTAPEDFTTSDAKDSRQNRMLKIRFTTKASPRMISQKGLVFLSAAR